MHLFIVHQFPDYDNFVPITVNLKKNIDSSFSIMNIFPVHNLKFYGFNELLKKYKIQFVNVNELNKKSLLISLLLKFTIFFPKFVNIKLNRVWYYFYHKYTLFHRKHVVAFIKKHKIKSINIDHGLPGRYKQILYEACKETNIKYNCYIVGIELGEVSKIKTEDFSLYDHTIVQDQIINIEETEENKKKFIRIVSPRYSLDWIEEVEGVYKYKLKEYNPDSNNRKLKVLIMTRPRFSEKSWQTIYEELKKIDNVELKIKFKPRGQFRPLHIQKNITNEYNTSELINWADVIVAHSSSVLIEAIIKNKKILFLNFLFDLEKKEKSNYVFENQNIVEDINSKEELITRLKNLNKAKFYLGDNEKYQESKKLFLQKIFGNHFFDKENIYRKEFINIYLN